MVDPEVVRRRLRQIDRRVAALRTVGDVDRETFLADLDLHAYLLATLNELASTPTVREVLARVGRRAGGRLPLADAVQSVRAARNRG